MNDVIVDIPGFEGRYGITRSGHVYNLNRRGQLCELHGCILTGKYNYSYVNILLRQNGGVKSYSLRQLLAKTFLPDYEDGCIVELIDSSKDLCADNLRVKRDDQGRVVHTRCKIRDVDSGEIYPSLCALSRTLCGNNSLKATLSQYVHEGKRYKGHLYEMI